MKLEYIILFSLLLIIGSQLFFNKTRLNGVKKDVNNINKNNNLGNFPRPQISRGYQQLSKNTSIDPLYKRSIKEIKDSNIDIIRSSNLDNDKNPIYYKPEFYKKDFISPNPIGSTEYSFADFDTEKTINAWTDNNVSQHPSFYRSEITNEKTNVGKFFDKDNVFHDKTSVYSTNNLPDRCFLDKNDNVVCNFNDRLQNIPPSLIDRKHKNTLLNRIGDNTAKNVDNSSVESVYGNNYLTFEYENELEMNGGEVFKGVEGSNSMNETYLNLNSIDSVKNVAI